nr:hypothetical protein [Tanacetum cinerariifolium]
MLVLVSPTSMHYKIPNDLLIALKLLKTDEDLCLFVNACCENNLKIDLFIEHNGYDIIEMIYEELHSKKHVSHVDSDSDVEINYPLDDVAHVVEQFKHEDESNVNISMMTTDDPWLNNLVGNSTFIGHIEKSNPNLPARFLLEVEDPDDEQVDCNFKAKKNVSYHGVGYILRWTDVVQLLRMRFQRVLTQGLWELKLSGISCVHAMAEYMHMTINPGLGVDEWYSQCKDANPIRTLGDYSKTSHKGYMNTIELSEGNNVVPLRSETIRGPHDTQYCMENPEQAFVEYASLHTDEEGVLEVLAHALIYNVMLDKYVESLELDVEFHIGKLKLLNDFYVVDMKKYPETPLLVGRGFLATANAVINCKKAKIAVGEGITMSVFKVKGVDLGEEEAPYWTTLRKRKTYKPRPSSDGVEMVPELWNFDKLGFNVRLFDENLLPDLAFLCGF